jgi:hypothetical protein
MTEAMVEVGMIDYEGLPACLCCLVADHLTVATAIHRRRTQG